MSLIFGFFILVEGIVSALLIAIILIQKSKGGMGGSAFGGGMGEALFGSRMGNVLTKTTVILGTIFLINTILLTVLTARRSNIVGSVTDGQAPLQQQAPAQAPMVPQAQEAAPIELPAADAAPAVDAAAPIEIPAVNAEAPAAEAVPAAPVTPEPEAAPSK